MNKNRTNSILILSIFITMLSFATLVLFFKIIENKNKHTSKVLSTLEDKIVSKESASALSKKISEINQIHDTVSNYLVDPKEIDSFINYLEGLGSSSGIDVKVKGFEIDPSNKNNLTVRISLGGTFSGVMRTIMILENSPYQIHVIGTSLNKETSLVADTKGTKQTQITTWQAEISFNVLLSG